ncbi:IclR family transcriptional regulator [Bacillus testis]|uniref:IclR family transcriptional regulator n=1 Tax=Bacillus testis TaxID=1622072 RepID=UPI00067E6B88|nr:IclR family transcriptional regulator [Bacillus testis]
MAENKTVHRLNTVDNAISLLSLFLKYDTIGLMDIEKETGISKTAAFRLAVTLADRGILIKDAKTKLYSPGPLLLQIVRRSQTNDIVTIAQSYLQELAEITKESVYLSIRSGNKYIYLSGIDSNQFLKVSIPCGDELDLHFGAAGKLHMAYMADSDIDTYFKRNNIGTLGGKNTDHFRNQLEAIKQRGYSLSLGESYAESSGIVTPIWGMGEEPAATIGIYLPTSRLTSTLEQRFIDLALTFSKRIGKEIKNRHQ